MDNQPQTITTSSGTAFKTGFFASLGVMMVPFVILIVVLLLSCCACIAATSLSSSIIDQSNSSVN